MGTTVKLTRIGTGDVDNVPIELFINAVKRGNIIDEIIIINDIPYDYSSAQFPSGVVMELIKIGSITAADMNAASGSTFVAKNFFGAKPTGKMIVNFYSKVKIPFAGGPAPANAQFLSTAFYSASNPIPNTAGFIQTTGTVIGLTSPTNSYVQADLKGQVNTVSSIPAGNPYTAGEIEFYIEVANIPTLQ